MRRLSFRYVVAACVVCATTSFGQISIDKHDGTTDFTSRGISGSISGFAYSRYQESGYLGGIGAPGNEVTGWNVIMQDQNCATLETWQFVIANESTTTAGTPDPANLFSATARFSSPPGSSTPCAWIYTLTFTSALPGPFQSDLFPGTFLPSNAAWTADGTSSHISIHNAGSSQEIPNPDVAIQYPPTTPGAGPGSHFGVNWSPGLGITYPGSWRIWLQRLKVEHARTLVGTTAHCGLYASIPAVEPDNMGMAGRFPDVDDTSGIQRFDDLVFQMETSSLSESGIAYTFLSTGLSRPIFGAPLSIPGIGDLELDPSDIIFNLSIGGAFPTLVGPVSSGVGRTSLAVGTGATPFWCSTPRLYGQTLLFDQGQGSLHLLNLFATWMFCTSGTGTSNSCAATLDSGVVTAGGQVTVSASIRNTGGVQDCFDWTLSKSSGTPTVNFTGNGSGSVTLASGAVHNFSVTIDVPSNTVARDAANIRLRVTGQRSTCGASSSVCVIPSGETTASNGWGSATSNNATVHRWSQTLTPVADFETRTVTERDPGGGGPDTCWFSGSSFAKFESITGDSWTVGAGNVWGDDYVGWLRNAVLYYRGSGRAPCGTEFSQDMVIDCPTGQQKYRTNVLKASFTLTHVTSERDGVSATKRWP